MKLKICITLGTRPEAIKLAPVIQKFRNDPDFSTFVVLTGQHKEMVAQVMEIFNLSADQNLEIMQPQQTLTDITYLTLQGLEKIYQQIKPDLVIVQGDTTTAFAASLAAFYQKIPIGHVEAGLRTDNIFNPYPEEANRRLISQITQLHFAPTTLAVENLQKSGVTGEIHLTGNTVIDALLTVANNEPICEIPNLNWEENRMYPPTLPCEGGKFRVLLTTIHRRENWGQPLQDILAGLKLILDKFPDVALLLPMHKNPTVREPIITHLGNHNRVFLTEPLDYIQLVGAIKKSYLLLTDSGGLQEEAPSLGKPVLVLRENTERPEAITAGTAKLIGTKAYSILNSASELLSDSQAYEKMANAINPFGDGTAAVKIVKIVKDYLKG